MKPLLVVIAVLSSLNLAFAQTPIFFTATWDAPGLPLTRQCTPWTANLSLAESNLTSSMELPTLHSGWSFEIYRQGAAGSYDALEFSLGSCGHGTPKSIVFIPFPGGGGNSGCPRVETCTLQGNVTLTADQTQDLLAGFWYLKATSFTDHRNPSPTIVQAQILPVDSDHDGVPDFRDLCPDTQPGERVNSDGCAIDQLAPCDGPWNNHGNYLGALKQVLDMFESAGIISKSEAKDLLKSGARSDCGK